MGMEKKNKKKAEKSEVGEGIEELLIRLRTEKGWSRVELMSKLPNKTIKEKDINRAVFCRILANKLREQIEEETI